MIRMIVSSSTRATEPVGASGKLDMVKMPPDATDWKREVIYYRCTFSLRPIAISP
jgi:hypothetical protein